VALLLHALGKREEAFEELDRAVQENSYTLLFSKVDPKADTFRGDPRFAWIETKLFRLPASAASSAV